MKACVQFGTIKFKQPASCLSCLIFLLAVEIIQCLSEFKNVNQHCVNIVAFTTVRIKYFLTGFTSLNVFIWNVSKRAVVQDKWAKHNQRLIKYLFSFSNIYLHATVWQQSSWMTWKTKLIREKWLKCQRWNSWSPLSTCSKTATGEQKLSNVPSNVLYAQITMKHCSNPSQPLLVLFRIKLELNNI